MKYIAVAFVALFVMGACSSSSKKDSDSTATTAVGQYTVTSVSESGNIVDQEFDLLVAPEYDYETDVKYEDQIKNKPVKKTAPAKSAKKPAATKQ